jgi:hypothetical protein
VAIRAVIIAPPDARALEIEALLELGVQAGLAECLRTIDAQNTNFGRHSAAKA